MTSRSVLVLGCGVSGLSSGILLLQAGHAVTIWARELPPHTTSNQAAALWFPYLAHPIERVGPWASRTLAYFRQHLLPDPASGCRPTLVQDLYAHPVETPWWAGAVAGYRRLAASELPAGYMDGFETESVVIDTSVYMDYLVAWFLRLGGQITQREVTGLDQALAESKLVVNCTGLGSRQLFGDESLYPVRGQTVKVRPNGVGHSILDDEGPNGLGYIIPRSADIVLGGTAQANDWDTSVRAADQADILRKAANLHPAFASESGVQVLSSGVGLRPVRHEVRLEAERIGEATVVHNYGHGGAGFTLSWGCAEEARMKAEG